jgi:O-antigen ligase
MVKRLDKIIEYGLYLLVFLLPIQTRWIIKAGELNGGYSEYGTISLYGTDILLIILIALFGYSKIGNWKLEIACLRRQGNWKLNYYWWLIAGLELMIFISIFVAPDKLVAIFGYLRFLLGIGLFWLIISANFSRIKLIVSLLLGIMGQAWLGIWQFLAQDSFSCKWLGLAMHHAGSLGTSVVETLAGERWLRAYGGLDHPNMLGGLLVIGILLTVLLLVINHKFQIPNSKQITNYKLQITIYFLLLTFITALFFTFSRGAWAGLLVGLLAMLIIAVIRKDLLVQKKILSAVLAGGIMVFVLFTQYQDLTLTRLSKDTRLEIKSNIERVESFEMAKELIKDNWLLGVGMGNYTKAAHDQITDSQPSYFYQPVHNVFLLVLAEIGFFGLLFFLGFLLLTSYFLLKRFKENQGLNIYRFLLIAALVVMFLVDHWWWSLHFGILLFWLVMGLMTKEEKSGYYNLN